MSSLQQPYNYLQTPNAQINNRDKVNENIHTYNPVHAEQSYSQLERGRISDQTEILIKESESGRNAKLSNGHYKALHLKEKGLRDSWTRVLPRTDIDVYNQDGLLHQKTKIDSSNSLANQIESHLSAKKVKKSQRGNAILSKPKVVTKREENNDRSITSMENSNNMKQLNGFSYGIQEDQVGRYLLHII